nr:ThuA domain-containing protein [Planctomycetota bacterium]
CHIVFVAGDEEYRSEEALPLLARSMNALGFECTVLFSQNPETGEIDPNESTYIPGLEKIIDADLLVLQLRFRELTDSDMKYVVDYVEAGKPLIGIRTSTHAFNYKKNKESKYAHWSWASAKWPGGFGKQILGETWVAHHGHHGKQATRGLVASKHAVANGVDVCFGTTDVYAINDLPDDATVILHGEVVAGMKVEDAAVAGAKNDPMHPVAWLRERVLDEKTTQRIFATTMGAAADWCDIDLRRLFINSTLWCLDNADAIPVNGFPAPLIGEYQPTNFGFDSARLGYKPNDYRNGSPWQETE